MSRENPQKIKEGNAVLVPDDGAAPAPVASP